VEEEVPAVPRKEDGGEVDLQKHTHTQVSAPLSGLLAFFFQKIDSFSNESILSISYSEKTSNRLQPVRKALGFCLEIAKMTCFLQ
jgi:hypothetical protein